MKTFFLICGIIWLAAATAREAASTKLMGVVVGSFLVYLSQKQKGR